MPSLTSLPQRYAIANLPPSKVHHRQRPSLKGTPSLTSLPERYTIANVPPSKVRHRQRPSLKGRSSPTSLLRGCYVLYYLYLFLVIYYCLLYCCYTVWHQTRRRSVTGAATSTCGWTTPSTRSWRPRMRAALASSTVPASTSYLTVASPSQRSGWCSRTLKCARRISAPPARFSSVPTSYITLSCPLIVLTPTFHPHTAYITVTFDTPAPTYPPPP